ncbi:MAG: hypothetical protein ACFFDW_04335 [Candidatus Thorarchaeota archaeon]
MFENYRLYKQVNIVSGIFIGTFLINLFQYIILIFYYYYIDNESLEETLIRVNWAFAIIFKILLLFAVIYAFTLKKYLQEFSKEFMIIWSLLVTAAAINIIPFDFIILLGYFFGIFATAWSHSDDFDPSLWTKALLVYIIFETLIFILYFTSILLFIIDNNKLRKNIQKPKMKPIVSGFILLSVLLFSIIFHQNGTSSSGLIHLLAFYPPIYNWIFYNLLDWYIIFPIQITIILSVIIFFLEILLKSYKQYKILFTTEKINESQIENIPELNLTKEMIDQ